MQKLYLTLLTVILASLLASCAGSAAAQAEQVATTPTPESIEATITPEVFSKIPPADCPLTVPQDPPFVPPAPYDKLGFKGDFWYGSNSLWTAISRAGIWNGLPFDSSGYTEKIFWWREGYIWTEEPEPDLTVTGERLDAKAPPLSVSKATNAYAGDIGSAMLVGVEFPTPGCWKITGRYKNAELSFVVWLAP